ncbi:TPA: hypothetical protein JG871_003934 [Enterobacter hormaechei subsp. xiangfangensis]|nr:hypothetical protein [Enterobacter hormaechei subsp. xiangfangensis]
MKTYKAVILAIMLILNCFQMFGTLATYGAGYWSILMLLTGIAIWFNWQYSAGEWPEMTFLKALGVGYVISAGAIYVVAICFADKYQHGVGEMLGLLWEKTPNVYISPAIVTPISLLIWRWLMKEPRLARQQAAALAVTELKEAE